MSEAELKNQIKEGRVLLDFYADWCGPCKMLARELKTFESEPEAEEVNVIKANVDTYSEMAAAFGVRSIPALFYLENGEVVDKHIGTANVQQIKKLVSNS